MVIQKDLKLCFWSSSHVGHLLNYLVNISNAPIKKVSNLYCLQVGMYTALQLNFQAGLKTLFTKYSSYTVFK